MSVHRLVLTGGPCGGKSSAVDAMRKAFTEKGIEMYFAPEVATILLGNGGCVFPGLEGKEKLVAFETALTELQQQMEYSFTMIARSTGKQVVVIFDRGIMDNAAYLPEAGWNDVLQATGLSPEQILGRYDSVLHLVTAADGAEKFYKWGQIKDDAGKVVYRQESPEVACDLDIKIAAAWSSHPHVSRIENKGTFADKMDEAVAFVMKRIAEMPTGTATSEDLSRLSGGSNFPNVHRNVLTGGPCGGKSSALDALRKALVKKGIDVYCAPEVATILFSGGCVFPGLDGGDALVSFETALTQLQMQMEKSFGCIAQSTGKPSIVFLDRGILDNAAYLPEEGWAKVLTATGLTTSELLHRYDSVLHLVTAADGAEQFYKWGKVMDDSGGNVYRQESPEIARELDQKITKAWAAHGNVGRIENKGSFKDKMDDATAFIEEQCEKTLSPSDFSAFAVIMWQAVCSCRRLPWS